MLVSRQYSSLLSALDSVVSNNTVLMCASAKLKCWHTCLVSYWCCPHTHRVIALGCESRSLFHGIQSCGLSHQHLTNIKAKKKPGRYARKCTLYALLAVLLPPYQ